MAEELCGWLTRMDILCRIPKGVDASNLHSCRVLGSGRMHSGWSPPQVSVTLALALLDVDGICSTTYTSRLLSRIRCSRLSRVRLPIRRRQILIISAVTLFQPAPSARPPFPLRESQQFVERARRQRVANVIEEWVRITLDCIWRIHEQACLDFYGLSLRLK